MYHFTCAQPPMIQSRLMITALHTSSDQKRELMSMLLCVATCFTIVIVKISCLLSAMQRFASFTHVKDILPNQAHDRR
jgi:hypothetical protein